MAKTRLRGFSLIELLVVVSVIALLVTVLLPALGGAKASARQVACLGRLGQIQLALQLYSHDSDDLFIDQYDGNNDGIGAELDWTERGLGRTWGEYLADVYLNAPVEQAMRCPEVPDNWLMTNFHILYGHNNYLNLDAWYAWTKRRQVRQAGKIIQTADSAWYDLGTGIETGGYYHIVSGLRVHLRHRGGANIGYVDGHARLRMIEGGADGHPLKPIGIVPGDGHPDPEHPLYRLNWHK